MILADVFKSSEFARLDYTTNDRDCPVVVQFAAHDPVDLAHAAQLVAPYADGIDLNCGCPQKWAYKECIGAYLSERPEMVQEMVRSVKGAVDIPCSIKIRKHPTDMRQTIELVRRAEKLGIDWITVHGRTRHQKSTEPVDYEAIKLAKESVSIPVLANGGIFTLADADEMYNRTGVAGVMSARGLLQNPALFAGYAETPLDCVEKYINLALAYGTPTFIFHHHLMYMMESMMSGVERKTFNCEIQIVPLGTAASLTPYIAKVKAVIENSGLQHTMHDSGTNFQGEYSLVTKVAQECMQSVLDSGAPRVLCYLKFGARTDKDVAASDISATEKVDHYLQTHPQ
ncbi:tRNA dihydrouridine synthase [Coemansia sp. RSA 1807]|nr:tRNA dihydrouridine synthase [Coemansia sp. RSA 1807]